MLFKKIKTQWNTLNTAAKASLVFMLVSFMNEGVRFLTTPIYTRLLDVREYGITSLYYSWESILGVFAMLSLQYGIFNNGMYEFRKNRDIFISSILLLSNIATISLFAVMAVLFPITGNLLGLDLQLFFLMFLVFMLKPANNFWVAKQRYEFSYMKPAIYSLLSSILSPLFGIIGLLYLNGTRSGIKLWMSYLPYLVLWIGFYGYTFWKTKFKIKVSYMWFALKYSIPLIPHYASQYVLSASDRIMIARLVNEASAGIYGIAATAASVVSIVWNSINVVLTPWTYEKIGKKKYEDIFTLTKWVCVLYATFCILIMLVAPEFMRMIAPSAYREGIYLIPPIIAATFFSGIYCLFGNIELFYKKVNMIMWASTGAAILNIILNGIFIRKYGYQAAAYTTFVCYLAYTIFHYFNMKRIEKANLYDIKFISGISVTVVISALLIPRLYDGVIVRLCILLCFTITLFLLRERILGIFKELKK